MRRAGTPIGGLLAGTLASATLAGVLALHVRTVLSAHVGPWQVDAVTEVAVTAVGALVALWLTFGALLATVCVLVRVAGASWRAGERLVHRCAPQVVRKALVLAVGAGIGLGTATGASAVAPEPSAPASAVVEPVDSAVRDDLGWAVSTTSTSTPTLAPQATPAATATPGVAPTAPEPADGSATTAPAPPAEVAVETTAADHPVTAPARTGMGAVVVEAGDSLWSIAARHLPPGATDAHVAAAWPHWYQANSAVIGADPDLIRPGQVLTVPATVAVPAL
ncbi:LysM peptidoglycan-binding domain-containing protein [Cellulomonas sp. Leaf334]|uniref:LysM peptidoglycan-binding domain-containing protein n=1 Tax=Cellulomonas sp. Leaf334 TaxID=1736339 RepID=UPI0006F87287|nr:LysM domain-containing protein [Cellulomonas sp. Leaf334]KQR16650.1 hypothetical protein ASF78_04615 [Cellulomonas sp. Leaf334]